jgi:hypothetical protein
MTTTEKIGAIGSVLMIAGAGLVWLAAERAARDGSRATVIGDAPKSPFIRRMMLQEMLKNAVRNEQYEVAARLRDEMDKIGI